jgi:hypothetical protein
MKARSYVFSTPHLIPASPSHENSIPAFVMTDSTAPAVRRPLPSSRPRSKNDSVANSISGSEAFEDRQSRTTTHQGPYSSVGGPVRSRTIRRLRSDLASPTVSGRRSTTSRVCKRCQKRHQKCEGTTEEGCIRCRQARMTCSMAKTYVPDMAAAATKGRLHGQHPGQVESLTGYTSATSPQVGSYENWIAQYDLPLQPPSGHQSGARSLGEEVPSTRDRQQPEGLRQDRGAKSQHTLQPTG